MSAEKMTQAELSQLYFRAAARIHDLANEMYENLHQPNGLPVESQEEVATITNKYSRWYRSELDFIRSSIQEYLESL